MLRETSGRPARYYRGGSAASALGPDDLQDVPVEEARTVFVTGITAMLGDAPRRAALTLLDRARGLRVVDPNLRSGLWGSGRAPELVLPLIRRCDLLLGGVAELSTLLGGGGRDLADRCRALGPKEVVLKAGPDGAMALVEDRWHEHRPPARAEVDPVGAGDAFDAGYLAARLAGLPVPQALALGAACGAAVASTVGDTGDPATFPRTFETEGGT
jgi:2-dehydro-3-deoxygluconokinase